MDYEGKPLKVDDIIVFNFDASIYRENYMFVLVKKIYPSGRLDVNFLDIKEEIVSSTPTGSTKRIKPTLSVTNTASLNLKRGMNAAPGYYRWNGRDILIHLFDKTVSYTESICF